MAGHPPSDPGPLCREHAVPMWSQLAAGFEAAIRDGHLAAGARLPSTRDLARRLGVDRGTVGAAYHRLRRRGLVEGPGRSRLRVAGIGNPRKAPIAAGRPAAGGCPARDPPARDGCASRIAGACLERARTAALRAGIPREEVERALYSVLGAGEATAREEARDPTPSEGPVPGADAATLPLSRPVCVAEPLAGLRRTLAAELAHHLDSRVVELRDLRRAPPGATVLVRPEVLSRVSRRLDAPACGGRRYRDRPFSGGSPTAPAEDGAIDLLPLPLAGGTLERGIVRRRLRRGVVVLITGSHTLRRYATELAAREFDRGVSFVALDPQAGVEIVRAVACARLVLADRAALAALPAGLTLGALPIRLVPPALVRALRVYLRVPRFEPGPRPAPGREPGRPRRDVRATAGRRGT